MFDPLYSDIREYLISYGTMGEFGRFRPRRPMTCRRGETAVARTHRGLELGTVLCEARAGHASFLPNTSVGELVRRATPEDRQSAAAHHQRAQDLFREGRRLASELALPLEVVDAEVLLEGEQAILHVLAATPCDERPLVSTLSRESGLFIAVHHLGEQASALLEEEVEATCGAENCGQGHCDSHGGGGGCSTCAVATIFKGAKKA